MSKNMQKIRSTLLVILMMTAALAGCISEDTSDLDAQIEDLDTQNTELTQTIAERDLAISELEATIAGLESNVAGLEASIKMMEEQRDALLALLSDSQEFANQTLELAEAMNETIAALHVMLGENATQVLHSCRPMWPSNGNRLLVREQSRVGVLLPMMINPLGCDCSSSVMPGSVIVHRNA